MKNILIIADAKGKSPAIKRGLSLAASLGASAKVVGFCYESLRHLKQLNSDAELTHLQNTLLQKRRKELESEIAKNSQQDAGIAIEMVWAKDISSWICDYAKQHSPDMVIKTSHASETLTYTPTDWQLIRNCPSPLLIVASKRWRKNRHVMAAVDITTKVKSKQNLNLKVAALAQALSQQLDCELHLGAVVPVSNVLKDMGMIDAKEQLRQAKSECLPPVKEKLADAAVNTDNFHVKTGDPSKVLVTLAAKNNCDLVVMGTVGRKGVKGKLLGNTAEKTLSLLGCDVLVVKPD